MRSLPGVYTLILLSVTVARKYEIQNLEGKIYRKESLSMYSLQPYLPTIGSKTLDSPAGKQRLKEPEQHLDFYFRLNSKVRWTNPKDTSEKPDVPHSIEKKILSLLESFLSNDATLNLKILFTPKVVYSSFLFKSRIDLKKIL